MFFSMNHNLFFPFHRLIGRIDELVLNRRSSRLPLCHETLTKDIKVLLEIDSSQYAAFLSIFNVRDGLEGVFRLIRFQNHQERSWHDEFFSVSLNRDFSVTNIRKENIAVKNPEVEIPGQFGHPFRLKSATDSGANRPVIPIQIGHLLNGLSNAG